MALTLTELQSITDFYVDSTDNDIYFKSNALLFKLLAMGKTIPGGKKIQVVLEHAKGNTGSYGATTKLPLSKKEIYNAAFFRWAAYFAGVTVDLEDQRQNSGDLAIVNMVNGKLKNAQKGIRQEMAEAVYTAAASADALLGLGDLFNASSSTAYGEIAEDDMAAWKANVDTTAEDISFTVMQKIRRLASIDDNTEGKPNLYITTEALKDGYEASLQTQTRYSDVKLVDSGFDNILFGGAPIVADNKQA
ncbi:phage major capsid protein, partial [bacterium]|nr:phage major capsid protein [bacterium]